MTYGCEHVKQENERRAKTKHQVLSCCMQDAVRAEVELVLAGLGDLPDRRGRGLAQEMHRGRTG